jgi:hypothetical protein
LQPLRVEFVERQIVTIEVVKDSKLHADAALAVSALDASLHHPRNAQPQQGREGCGASGQH